MVTARSLPEMPFFGGQSNHSVALACALAFFAVRLLADFFFGSGAEDEPKKPPHARQRKPMRKAAE
jgi:hypothetical protein